MSARHRGRKARRVARATTDALDQAAMDERSMFAEDYWYDESGNPCCYGDYDRVDCLLFDTAEESRWQKKVFTRGGWFLGFL